MYDNKTLTVEYLTHSRTNKLQCEKTVVWWDLVPDCLILDWCLALPMFLNILYYTTRVSTCYVLSSIFHWHYNTYPTHSKQELNCATWTEMNHFDRKKLFVEKAEKIPGTNKFPYMQTQLFQTDVKPINTV